MNLYIDHVPWDHVNTTFNCIYLLALLGMWGKRRKEKKSCFFFIKHSQLAPEINSYIHFFYFSLII